MAATLIDSLLRAQATTEAGLTFVDRHEREARIPWATVVSRARVVAGGLQALGIGGGDRVAVVHPTSAEFFDAFFGAVLAGAVPVPLYPPVRLGRLDEYQRRTGRMIRQVGARVVLADPRVRRILGEAVRRSRPRHGCRTVDGLPDGPWVAPDVAPDDLALVQFSSGTTVEPKPVALSHRAVLAQARALNHLWPTLFPETPAGVSWLPLYHDMGLIGCIVPALELRTEMTLLPPEAFVARPALWLRALSRTRAPISPAPNFAYALAVRKIRDEELDGVDLSSWRVALNGAEAVVPDVQRRFAERFARWGFREDALTPVYGLSEAALAVTFSDLGRPPRTERFDRGRLSRGRAQRAADGREIASVGRPLRGFELRVVDDRRRPLPEGRVGDVLVRGPSLMDGYLGLPEATARALQGGWLDTGDRGFVRDGELWLTGRRKDLLLLRGRNHAPEEVEHAIDEVPGVRRGCVAAVSWLPEEGDGEELVVFVETRQPDRGERLIAACRAAAVRGCGLVPDRVILLAPGTLPRTSSGKLRRSDALRRWRDGSLRPPRTVTWARLAGALLRSRIAYARTR